LPVNFSMTSERHEDLTEILESRETASRLGDIYIYIYSASVTGLCNEYKSGDEFAFESVAQWEIAVINNERGAA